VKPERISASDNLVQPSLESVAGSYEKRIVCPVCGAAVVQEKCKLICRSEKKVDI